jgi:hypothetical protein
MIYELQHLEIVDHGSIGGLDMDIECQLFQDLHFCNYSRILQCVERLCRDERERYAIARLMPVAKQKKTTRIFLCDIFVQGPIYRVFPYMLVCWHGIEGQAMKLFH